MYHEAVTGFPRWHASSHTTPEANYEKELRVITVSLPTLPDTGEQKAGVIKMLKEEGHRAVCVWR